MTRLVRPNPCWLDQARVLGGRTRLVKPVQGLVARLVRPDPSCALLVRPGPVARTVVSAGETRALFMAPSAGLPAAAYCCLC